jgi:hypothetical protein
MGLRGGIRWGADIGCRARGVQTSAGQHFASRRPAVAWVFESAPALALAGHHE